MSSLDLALFRALRTRGHAPALERAVRAYSRLGEHGAVWVALGLGGAARQPGRRTEWLAGVRTVLRSYALNQLVKFVVRRPRPRVPGLPALIHTRTQLSFPSAHAATSVAAVRAYGIRGLGLPAAVMAVSRVYLGVHWPSDVVAGALLGRVVAR